MNEHEFRELSAARALHALTPDEEHEFSVALAAHPEWRAIAETDRETAAALGADAVAPPARLRASILDAIERSPQGPDAVPTGEELRASARADGGAHRALVEPEADQASPAVSTNELANGHAGGASPDELASPARKRLPRAAWFALAASIAVIAALVLTPAVRTALTPQDPVSLALAEVESAPDAATATVQFDGGEATLHWSAETSQVVFVADAMPEIGADQDFEMWLVRGDAITSLGVFDADDAGRAGMATDGFENGDALAVTVEDEGGSPTGVATTDPIIVVGSA